MEFSTLVVLLAAVVALNEASHLQRRLPSWETPRLPEVKRATVHQTRRAKFHGHVPRELDTTCGMDCQRNRTTRPFSTQQLEEELAYETLDMDGLVLTNTLIEVGDVPPEIFAKNNTSAAEAEPEFEISERETVDTAENRILNRRKRNIFGLDTRFSLSSRRYMTMYPFTTAVKLSTGCSGVLLSPKHVLTSAHCIHDGKRYVKGVRKLKIGKQMKTPQKQRRGRKGGKKRRKNRRKKPAKKGNSVDVQENQPKKRVARDLSLRKDPIAPYFKWVRAKKTHLPQGWLKAAARNRKGEFPVEFDYAVIELRRALGTEYMDVGICPEKEVIPSGHRIHFTGFDTDRSNEMLYRFCPIEDESPDLMYHYCDAQEGTSGSGMYIRLYDRATGNWSRRVIAVFSGHQRVIVPGGTHKEFNTGVRITPLKYAQICYWVKGSYDECRGG